MDSVMSGLGSLMGGSTSSSQVSQAQMALADQMQVEKAAMAMAVARQQHQAQMQQMMQQMMQQGGTLNGFLNQGCGCQNGQNGNVTINLNFFNNMMGAMNGMNGMMGGGMGNMGGIQFGGSSDQIMQQVGAYLQQQQMMQQMKQQMQMIMLMMMMMQQQNGGGCCQSGNSGNYGTGQVQGYNQGYAQGYNQGYNNGYHDAYRPGSYRTPAVREQQPSNRSDMAGRVERSTRDLMRSSVDNLGLGLGLPVAAGVAVGGAAIETAVKPVDTVVNGFHRAGEIHDKYSAERTGHMEAYQAGESSLMGTVGKTAWTNTKEGFHQLGNALYTGGKAALEVATTPLRFIGNTLGNLFGK